MAENELKLYSCEYIMDTAMTRNKFIVDKMLYAGLYILAGAPKVGKSWLALDLCISVASGKQFLKQETNKGQVLYLALEDSLLRLQSRVYEFTDEPVDGLNFAILASSIGSGLEEQLNEVKQQRPELKLIVIDTLQKVRGDSEPSYTSDYKELSSLKALADKLMLAIVLVHHTRKTYDNDPFNMISGTTGLSGCVDGSMVLMESKRGSRKGKLCCVGRDIENLELNVEFIDHRWSVTDSVAPFVLDTFPLVVHDLMLNEKKFVGSASMLCELFYTKYGEKYFPNRLTRDLVQHTAELFELGVAYRSRRSHGSRVIELTYDGEHDSGQGSLLYSKVTEEKTEESARQLCLIQQIEPVIGSVAG